MAHRVVITGIGPVTSAGIGKEDFSSRIWAQRCNRQPVPAHFTRTYALHSRWYVPLPEFSLASHGLVLPHENIMQTADRMTVLGTKLALEDAGFLPVITEGKLGFAGVEEAGVVLGTALGSMQAALDSHLAHCLSGEVLRAALPERRLAFSRMVVSKTMPNSPAAWASICFGLSGPCHTLNASCASGTCAIGEAFRKIRDGYAQVMLAGGVESFQDQDGFMMRGFDVLGVLTQSADGLPRPFGRNRSGFLFAEGGACLPPNANLLALRIQPDEGISLAFEAKAPGMRVRLQPVKMDFRYGSSFGEQPPEAYERLLLDAMLGDSTLYTRADEVEHAWRFVDSILAGWRQSPPPAFPNYAAGTWGPAEADRLMEGTGAKWRRL